MLAEIAIANAAFGVIKEAIGNGKDLYEMGGVVAQFFDRKLLCRKSQIKMDTKVIWKPSWSLRRLRKWRST